MDFVVDRLADGIKFRRLKFDLSIIPEASWPASAASNRQIRMVDSHAAKMQRHASFNRCLQHIGKPLCCRFIVERTSGWLQRFRRLRFRHEGRPDIHQVFLSLACSPVCWRYVGAVLLGALGLRGVARFITQSFSAYDCWRSRQF